LLPHRIHLRRAGPQRRADAQQGRPFQPLLPTGQPPVPITAIPIRRTWLIADCTTTPLESTTR
jgi:hypothetical protein